MGANGIELCCAGCTENTFFDDFYMAALKEIEQRIAQSQK